jgi:arylsulfatase
MTPPNILFIMTDQMRPDALGFQTPNLDALAKRGVKFTNAYTAAPLCQPGRNCIITGRHPTQHGVCGNQNPPISLAERADTYANHLRELGYRTALIGKHHYYDRFNLGVDLTDDDEDIRGYGYDFVWQVGDVAEGRRNEDRFTKYLRERGKLDDYRENMSADYIRRSDPGDTVDGYIGDTALKYLADYNLDQPLHLYVGFVAPHGPYWVPEQYDVHQPASMPPPLDVDGPGEIASYQRARAAYQGMITMIDDYVGKLVAALAVKGMLDNTFILFSSDHGNMMGDHGLVGKRWFFEASARVPLVMAGAGLTIDPRVELSAVNKALVSTIDYYATFLDVAGAEHIQGSAPREGLSLLRVVDERGPYHAEVYSELGTMMMIRDANWKLVFDPEQGGVQFLFNLRRDPDEYDNLAGVPAYSGVEKALTEKMLSRLIRLTHTTHDKERINVQRVRI